ncbi:aquaporin [Sanguibacter sp. HDW7]|uniref:aquaporin n=1 Tax=Sanguibacter sp. HDW7 TaxID=2714931 RepID=UPI0014084CF3|nr:aquaporin [Sanguibacter sp. HDW7]QIK82823.1 MIP family channel protein [Sanguibacter sp. HDW7]
MSLTDAPAYDAADATFDELALEPAQPSLLLRAGAELFGTFVLVLLGVGAGIYTSLVGGNALATALAFGLGATAAIAIIGSVSGGHINPAVTLGAAIAGRFRWADVPVYMLAQVVGATIAGAILRAILPPTLPAAIGNDATAGSLFSSGANGYGAHAGLGAASGGAVDITLMTALIVEIVLTMILVAVVLSVTTKRAASNLTPLWVGLTITVTLLVATPFTGGSVNPARSLGVAFFADPWALKQVWVFVAAPLVGAVLAGLVARIIALGTAPVALEDEPEVVEIVELSEDGELVAAADEDAPVADASDDDASGEAASDETASTDGDAEPARS